jgi:hypothetical protein
MMNSYTGLDGLYACVKPVITSNYGFRLLKQALRRDGSPGNPGGMDELETDPHVTVMYSQTPVKVGLIHRILVQEKSKVYKGEVEGLDYWGGHDKRGYLVVKVRSPELQALHEKFKAAGAIPSYSKYNPHMTVVKGFQHPKGFKTWVTEFGDSLAQQDLVVTLGSLSIDNLN